MSIHLITYTDANMTKAAEICCLSALQNNCDTAAIYGPGEIDKKFYAKNRAILDDPRAGFWLWKPYIIDKALKSGVQYLVYADAGVEFINNIRYVIDRMDQDVWLFGNKFKHLEWCKADAFIPILSNQYYNYQGYQCQASVIVIKNTDFSRKFVADWLEWCQYPDMIDDSPSKLPNIPTFSEHRHDQALLTCMAIREDIKLHWWPAQYNCGAFTYEKTGYNDVYPVLFHHHRSRDIMWQQTDELSRKFQTYFKQRYNI